MSTQSPPAQYDLFRDLFDTSVEETNEFMDYHKEHPEVYETFKELVLKTIAKGFKRYSARGIFQIARWHRGGEIKEDGFKINNNYTPYYVRLFERDCPEHEDFFQKRKVKKDLSIKTAS